jgi:hypothetical protein
MRAGARGKPAASGFAAAECAAHFGAGETEHVVQEKARALERRQTFENQHQRDREVMREIACRVRIEGLIHDRFGQPARDGIRGSGGGNQAICAISN